MKVLITGITGFVGSHLADYILEHQPEVEIYGLKRWRSPRDNIRHIEERLRLYDGDLRDLSSMLTITKEIKPDLIFHLAAQSFVPMSYSAPADTLTTNIIGTANLLEAVRILELDCRIHVCSSPEVYGQPSGKDLPITEEYPLRPLSPYGVSKVAEDALGYMYYQAYGLKAIRSRAFSHTGPRRGDVFVASAFAKQIAKIEAGLQEPVIRVGNLDSVRTLCDVRDTVGAYWLLLQMGELGEVYNIAGNERMDMRGILDILLAFSNIHPKIEVEKQLLRPKDVTIQIADDSKFRQLTGWKPRIPILKTLADILQYWREKEK